MTYPINGNRGRGGLSIRQFVLAVRQRENESRLPVQSGNAGKVLSTDGERLLWQALPITQASRTSGFSETILVMCSSGSPDKMLFMGSSFSLVGIGFP